MATIAVDVDEVVADLVTPWLAVYNDDWEDCLEKEDITGWNIHEYVDQDCGVNFYEYLTPSLYSKVLPVFGALEGIQKLRRLGHRVIFVTSYVEGVTDAKFQWLKRHGFFDDVIDAKSFFISAYNKSDISADVLIDDNVDNVKVFKGVGLIFRAPWNRNYSGDLTTVYSWDDVVKFIQEEKYLHITERSRPRQVQEFRKIIERMYRVHLDKNADYSPANILGVGENGLVTRSWDKVARLMNLSGFHVEISDSDFRPELPVLGDIWNSFTELMKKYGYYMDVESIKFDSPKEPKNESIDDTLMDLAVYAIIWMLLREDAWGK